MRIRLPSERRCRTLGCYSGPEVVAGIERLGIDRQLGQRADAVEERLQRSSAQAAGARRPHQLENRRHQIDVLHEVGDAAPRAGVRFLLDDERDVNRLLIDEEAVLLITGEGPATSTPAEAK